MPKRRAQFPHRYTTAHLSGGGKRVPFVRLSGRWLEAFGFKEGAKFAAVGVEGGLLVLVITKPRRTAARRALTPRMRPMLRIVHFRGAIPPARLALLLALRFVPC